MHVYVQAVTVVVVDPEVILTPGPASGSFVKPEGTGRPHVPTLGAPVKRPLLLD